MGKLPVTVADEISMHATAVEYEVKLVECEVRRCDVEFWVRPGAVEFGVNITAVEFEEKLVAECGA